MCPLHVNRFNLSSKLTKDQKKQRRVEQAEAQAALVAVAAAGE
jgi:hypothetical protein